MATPALPFSQPGPTRPVTSPGPNAQSNSPSSMAARLNKALSSPYTPQAQPNAPSPPRVPHSPSDRRQAWKYEGYPALSNWMKSSNDFFVLRRFGELNARVLLTLQGRIAAKEKELHELDKALRETTSYVDDKASIAMVRNDSVLHDSQYPNGRAQLIDSIKELLKEYSVSQQNPFNCAIY